MVIHRCVKSFICLSTVCCTFWGYDHMEESDKVQMRQQEELIMDALDLKKERIDGTEKHS